ncbi:MAG: CoA pyrophosphatase [Candidatus Eisenbacteria bacterium]|uniref:CoA pyrophosphatase n=1 Tax=Eiseniibacteriota bacterium TaxID=2212470 RepID=A0A956RR54_UNCEI|nr:CoA pyrophosphatase [Candidatus Eisenbacteria bacterium]
MSNDLRQRLRALLAGPLPGEAAHRDAWPLELPARRLEDPEPLRAAAVLLAIVESEGGFRVPLIERPTSMPHHAGQIGLPGGRLCDGESPRACALRESQEEIGLEPDGVEILGALTPVPIPVSGFRVEVFVGWVDRPPRWRIDAREVQRILEADLDALARDGINARLERRMVDGTVREVPAYRTNGVLVWGATALMLSEMLQIWRRLRSD